MGTKGKRIELTDGPPPGQWVSIVGPKMCPLPMMSEIIRRGAGDGSVWECNRCGQQYELTIKNVMPKWNKVKTHV